MADRMKRMKNITMGNKREAKEKRKDRPSDRQERKADNEEYLTLLTQSKINLKREKYVGPWVDGKN